MNNNRRLFVGALGAGVVALAVPQTVTVAQPKKRVNKQIQGFKRQLKMGLGAMNEGNPVGAIVVANALYSWADYFEDNDLDNVVRQTVRRHGPKRGTVNHKEMELLAKELGVDTIISVHVEPEPFDVQKAYDDLVKGDSISKRMRDGANLLVQNAQRWPNAANIRPIQAWGNGPNDCPVCAWAASYWQAATTLCEALAVAALFGPEALMVAESACGGAMAAALSFQAACAMAQVFGCT